MYKLLIIDDDESIRLTIKNYLINPEYEILVAENGLVGLDLIAREHPDVVITDLKMPQINGIDVLKKAKEIDSSAIIIIMTGFNDIESTIRAMQFGAFDYLSKPIDKAWLNMVVKKALDSQRLIEKIYVANTADHDQFAQNRNLVGNTNAMREIAKNIGIISTNRVSVLIQGESGSGKEVIAKTIHFSGITKDDPFIALNCSALNETLLESELFGHDRGAFTGAIKDKKGKFELAGEGTIFLDEISETSLNFQVKLLRVIQEREFERVGGEKSIPVKARIIASTNKDLEELVREGKFREDLYFRLKVFSIVVPPLRERKEDIPLLVVHFLEKINRELHKNVTKVPYDVMEFLQEYDYVGNVRELENMLINAVLLSKGNILTKEAFCFPIPVPVQNDSQFHHNLSLAEVEQIHIQNVLKSAGGDKNRTAKILGISRSTLYKKLEDYNIEL